MRSLREFLGLNQTRFGSMLALSQPDVSIWESPDRRDVPLPGKHAKLFLDVWDCFPEPPHGGFNEIMAAFAAYQSREMPPVNRGELVRLVPERAVAAVAPEIYWAPKENPPLVDGKASARSPDSGTEPTSTEQAGQLDIMRAKLSILGLSILFAVWRRARHGHSDATPMRRPTFARWAMVAPLLAFLLPTGCFQAHREGARLSAERKPLRVPSQIYTDPAKKTGAAEPQRSIPAPAKPYPWQKVAPCDQGETEDGGGCYILGGDLHPPCPEYTVENKQGKCLMPIPAKPKPSNSVTAAK